MFTYQATVIRWVDGDTVDLQIDLGFNISVFERCRVYGIDTPEVHTKDTSIKQKGIAAVTRVLQLAPIGSILQTSTVKTDDKYGRYLAKIKLLDGRDLGDTLISEGHAVAYFGGTKN